MEPTPFFILGCEIYLILFKICQETKDIYDASSFWYNNYVAMWFKDGTEQWKGGYDWFLYQYKLKTRAH